MGIKQRADSGFRKFRILSKLSLGGQVRSSEMPYVSYPRPLQLEKATHPPKEKEEQHMDVALSGHHRYVVEDAQPARGKENEKLESKEAGV